jgi:hypothetical protein
VVQALNHWNICKKILVTKFDLWDPDVILVAVNYCIQMGVLVLDGGTCGDSKEVGVVGTEVVVSFFKW